MNQRLSAGILPFRRKVDGLEFFLAHPGGPFFRNRDKGWWTIVKGEVEAGEDPMLAAIREFAEETGLRPEGEFIPLKSIVQKGGKTVTCWAVEFDLDESSIVSNIFEIECPPKSGKFRAFPEIDKAGWFDLQRGKELINSRQAAFLDELASIEISVR